MKKRILAVVLALAMVASLLMVMVSASETVDCTDKATISVEGCDLILKEENTYYVNVAETKDKDIIIKLNYAGSDGGFLSFDNNSVVVNDASTPDTVEAVTIGLDGNNSQVVYTISKNTLVLNETKKLDFTFECLAEPWLYQAKYSINVKAVSFDYEDSIKDISVTNGNDINAKIFKGETKDENPTNFDYEIHAAADLANKNDIKIQVSFEDAFFTKYEVVDYNKKDVKFDWSPQSNETGVLFTIPAGTITNSNREIKAVIKLTHSKGYYADITVKIIADTCTHEGLTTTTTVLEPTFLQGGYGYKVCSFCGHKEIVQIDSKIKDAYTWKGLYNLRQAFSSMVKAIINFTLVGNQEDTDGARINIADIKSVISTISNVVNNVVEKIEAEEATEQPTEEVQPTEEAQPTPEP